jgi:hypothetical protein
MHQALLLPEIVATILQSEKSSEGFLFTTLFINKLFFEETARILWEGCGTRYFANWVEHVTPDIRHLASIVQQDVKRAQIYADFIHVLYFECDSQHDDDFTPEAKWHPMLTKLDYPMLEEVAFYPAGEESTLLNTGANIKHYAQPNVSKFQVQSSSAISNELLEALSERCPRLRQFDLRVSEEHNAITPEALHQFLKRVPSLEVLDIPSLNWSVESFHEVSQFQKLELMNCPPIHNEWVSQLTSGFPNLTGLYTSISHDTLERLQHIVPGMKNLRIQPVHPSGHLLEAASKFEHLGSLVLVPPPEAESSWSISGAEIVLLAQNCSNLTELSIAAEEDSNRPAISGLTDATMDTAARSFKNLKTLILQYHNDVPLTFTSLQSFGKYCPNLECLEITCTVDWNYIAGNDLGTLFPNLWSMELTLHPNQVSLEVFGDTEDQPLAKIITDFAPKLNNFVLKNGGEGEDDLESAVTDIAINRYL